MCRDNMKIIQISVVSHQSYIYPFVYGLGDDGKVYMWNPENAEWNLDKLQPRV